MKTFLIVQYICISALCCAAPAWGRQAGVQQEGPATEEWTLDDCIGYALEHANEVRRQKIERRQAGVDYRAAVLDFLPTVSASAALMIHLLYRIWRDPLLQPKTQPKTELAHS